MINFNNTEFITSFGFAEQIVSSELPEVVFCGRSNVGKSSLLNKLCNRKNLARVSSRPGKTATVNLFKMDKKYYLIDLPGYGFARRSDADKIRWAELMEGFFASYRNMQLALVLVDSRHGPTQDDLDMVEYLRHAAIPFAFIMTKTDKLNKTELREQTETISAQAKMLRAVDCIPFSVNNNVDVENVKKLISKYLEIQ